MEEEGKGEIPPPPVPVTSLPGIIIPGIFKEMGAACA